MKSGHRRDATPARPQRVLARRMEKPASLGWHSHRELQWIHAGQGVATVETEDAKWLALPGEALTIGSHVMHNVNWFGSPKLTTVYFEPGLAPFDDGASCVLTAVSPLLAAAADELSASDEDERAELIGRVVMVEIPRRRIEPCRLPLPGGALRVLCRDFLDAPSDDRDVDACADAARMSRRTFTRQFRQKTGLTFVDWRRRLRAMQALELRMQGMSSKRVAEAVGYDSVQSFHASVKKAFGRTLGDLENKP